MYDSAAMSGGALVLACCLASTSSVSDQGQNGLDWRYRKADAWDYSAFAVAASITLAGRIAGPLGPERRGGVLFDDSVRAAGRLGTEAARLTARDVSDVLLGIGWAYPLLVDAFAVAGLYHGDVESATQLSLLSLEVFGVTVGLQTIFNVAFSRERPYAENCGGSISEEEGRCRGNNRFFSFFSGHASQMFSTAGVVCQNHRFLRLYSRDDTAWVQCTTGFVLAGLTAYLRIAADYHYATDVLVGAAVGTATGLLIPWLTRYRQPRRPSAVSVMLVPGPTGVSLVGVF